MNLLPSRKAGGPGLALAALVLLCSGSAISQAASPRAAASYPRERAVIEGAAMRQSHPHLGSRFEVLGPSTKSYNCIAHSLGIHDRWISPQTGPAQNPLAWADRLYAAQGYRRLPGLDFRRQPGVQKVVVYATRQPDGTIRQVTHAAVQSPGGGWTSKLGKLALIRHGTPQALNGPSYGEPVAVYIRRAGPGR